MWPVADPPLAMDPAKLLARYVGLEAHLETGTRYLVDPKTHRHLGCVPIYHDEVTAVSSFAVRAGPVLECHSGFASVTSGAYVSLRGATSQIDPALKQLPAVLDAAGAAIAEPWIVPPLRAPTDDELEFESSPCPAP
jgi:hypothetical protein